MAEQAQQQMNVSELFTMIGQQAVQIRGMQQMIADLSAKNAELIKAAQEKAVKTIPKTTLPPELTGKGK